MNQNNAMLGQGRFPSVYAGDADHADYGGDVGRRHRRLLVALAVAVTFAITVMGACDEQSSSQPSCPDPTSIDQGQPIAPTQTSIDDILADLESLSFEDFIEDSYIEILRRSPETVTEFGISTDLGMGDDTLDDVSEAYIDTTYDLITGIADVLDAYDLDALSPEEQRSHAVYQWYLDNWLRRRPFRHYDYPINPIVTSAHRQLLFFFQDIHLVRSEVDAANYIARLRQVDRKLAQVAEGLVAREEAGVIAPRFLLDFAAQDLARIAASEPRTHVLYTDFANKLATLPELGEDDKEALLNQAAEAIECHVNPGFAALTDEVERLVRIAPQQDGVWQFPDGDDYYKHALRHHTTLAGDSDSQSDADSIHELGLAEVARIREQMDALFVAFGDSSSDSLSTRFNRLANADGFVSGQRALDTYVAIIDDAEERAEAAFDLRPMADVVVIESGGGAFYVPGAPDGSRPGAFYAGVGGNVPRYGMPTLAYHEAVPGHHFQISIAQERDLPRFRRHTNFTAYAEGWALYAERLAAELGWYEADIPGDLGRLQAEAFRAARLVVDTGLHHRKWTFQQAVDYMVEHVGYPRSSMEAEVARYIAWPGQATAYKMGMETILRLRAHIEAELGDDYSLKDFHRLVLTQGSVPLTVLEQAVTQAAAQAAAKATMDTLETAPQ